MISVKKYKKNLSETWDQFVESSNNGTIYNTRRFLSYHIQRKFVDSSLCFFKQQKIVAVLPAAIKNNQLISHPGASYGGLIIRNNLKFAIIDKIITLLEQYCINNKILSIFLIPSPSIYWKKYDASLEYILEYKKFDVKESYISHAAPLDKTSPIINHINRRKQRYIKNYINNNEFQIIEHFSFADKYGKAFYEILELNKKKYSTTPTHSIRELTKLKKIFPDQIKLFISLKKKCVVGGAILFITNNNTSLVFYNAVAKNMRNTQLSAYQLYFCSNISEQLGMCFIDFGVSQKAETINPLSPKMSLIKFKEQLNAVGVRRKAYQKEFNAKK